tara:strand:+ start:50 stop:256 length:207 start_codon:yes stop_codon:yes gene_type:complete
VITLRGDYTTTLKQINMAKSKGLGDTIEKITTLTGIKGAIGKLHKVTGRDCGCKKRKDALNKAFPYKK